MILNTRYIHLPTVWLCRNRLKSCLLLWPSSGLSDLSLPPWSSASTHTLQDSPCIFCPDCNISFRRGFTLLPPFLGAISLRPQQLHAALSGHSEPYLAHSMRFFCSSALKLEKRKCLYGQLGGSRIVAAGIFLAYGQPLLGSCRDHVCFTYLSPP